MHQRSQSSTAESGFSLLELVVVVAVLTIVMGAAFSLMNRSQQSFDQNQLLAEAHQNADFAVIRVTELIRGAGANPEGFLSGGIQAVTNLEAGSSTANTSLIRVRADLDGDEQLLSRVDPDSNASAKYYILSSEDITIKFLPDGDAQNNIPRNTLAFVDNTPDSGGAAIQGKPFILAQHISDFEAVISADGTTVTLTVTAGPSTPIAEEDPRWVTFTRVMQVRLRNRFS
jgi:prepilin-type N-terminal cleavage/methylation domain-containing protein